jgi:hypothetical protein
MTALSINESAGEVSSPLSSAYQRNSPIPAPTGYIAITADPVSAISSPSGSMLNTARNAPYNGVGASRRLDCAGNWVDARDSVDSRIANAVANGTTLYGSYTYTSLTTSPHSQADLGAFPTLAVGTPCTDSDHDGIPDAWETAHGLNPNDASDAQKKAPNGYTYLENYLNGTDPNVIASATSATGLGSLDIAKVHDAPLEHGTAPDCEANSAGAGSSPATRERSSLAGPDVATGSLKSSSLKSALA